MSCAKAEGMEGSGEGGRCRWRDGGIAGIEGGIAKDHGKVWWWQEMMMTLMARWQKINDTKTWSSFIKLSNPLSSSIIFSYLSSSCLILHHFFSFLSFFIMPYPSLSCLFLHHQSFSFILRSYPLSSLHILYHPVLINNQFLYFLILSSPSVSFFLISPFLFLSHPFLSCISISYPYPSYLTLHHPSLSFTTLSSSWIIFSYPLPSSFNFCIFSHPYPFSSCLFLLSDYSKPFLVSIYRPF